MSSFTLQNQYLSIEVDEHGAELTSILNLKTSVQYLWNADPAYWKCHAPILFPIVGCLKDNSYTWQGKTYSMPQHGFARDMKFSLTSRTDRELWLSLEDTEETRKVYPFPFRLELGYRLEGNTITALWRVRNTGDATMYFSIGGHAAFLLHPSSKKPSDGNTASDSSTPSSGNTASGSNATAGGTIIPGGTTGHSGPELCSFQFDTEKPLHYLRINDQGLEVKQPFDRQHILETKQGICPIPPQFFDHGVLIIEENQCHQVSLLNSSKEVYLTVSFDAPLFGLWSPAGKNAPFVCIEPWYGRCDSDAFNGTLEEREYSNRLEPGEVFEKSYCIEIA